MEDAVYIYTLSDPRDDTIYYVGQTTDMRRRLWNHIYAAKTGALICAREKWIKSLLDDGIEPAMRQVDKTNAYDADNVEHEWIRRLHKLGYPLTNQEVQPKRTRPVHHRKIPLLKSTDVIDIGDWLS